jgi:hypothetical protein
VLPSLDEILFYFDYVYELCWVFLTLVFAKISTFVFGLFGLDENLSACF